MTKVILGTNSQSRLDLVRRAQNGNGFYYPFQTYERSKRGGVNAIRRSSDFNERLFQSTEAKISDILNNLNLDRVGNGERILIVGLKSLYFLQGSNLAFNPPEDIGERLKLISDSYIILRTGVKIRSYPENLEHFEIFKSAMKIKKLEDSQISLYCDKNSGFVKSSGSYDCGFDCLTGIGPSLIESIGTDFGALERMPLFRITEMMRKHFKYDWALNIDL